MLYMPGHDHQQRISLADVPQLQQPSHAARPKRRREPQQGHRMVHSLAVGSHQPSHLHIAVGFSCKLPTSRTAARLHCPTAEGARPAKLINSRRFRDRADFFSLSAPPEAPLPLAKEHSTKKAHPAPSKDDPVPTRGKAWPAASGSPLVPQR